MGENFSRTELLLGTNGMSLLKKSFVILFGVGGVGSYVAEALTRSDLGKIRLIDNDVVCESNLNRQIHANVNTIGKKKIDVMKERILQINPEMDVETFDVFVNSENALELIPERGEYEKIYVVDAIDTISAKLAIIQIADSRSIPIISSMGMANKLYPEKIELSDIYKTSVCPLAKVMRYELKKRGIKRLTVCYSQEMPKTEHYNSVKVDGESLERKKILGSTAFVPSAAGLIIAGKIIRDLSEVF